MITKRIILSGRPERTGRQGNELRGHQGCGRPGGDGPDVQRGGRGRAGVLRHHGQRRGRALFTDILTRVASEIFIPLTVGGGVNTLDDFDRVLKCGADKSASTRAH